MITILAMELASTITLLVLLMTKSLLKKLMVSLENISAFFGVP
jgi:hypothetical protein